MLPEIINKSNPHNFIHPIRTNHRIAPSFWVTTGIFFFAVVNFPLFAVLLYIFSKFGATVGYTVLAIINIIIIIKHLFFIKAYRVTGNLPDESFTKEEVDAHNAMENLIKNNNEFNH